jgi:hypothetical protein
MTRYVVAHVISSPAGAVKTARLVVEDVPQHTTKVEVIEALTAHGEAARFSEGGVPFGNHEVVAEGRAGWPKGLAGIDAAKVTTWETLTLPPAPQDQKRVTIRLSPAGGAAVALAARQADVSLQKWAERALLTAAGAPESAYLPRDWDGAR